MTEQQIPKLVGALVEHQGAFSSLSTDDGQWVIQNTKEAIGLFMGAIKNRPTKRDLTAEPLLEEIERFSIPALPAFDVGKFFSTANEKVKFAYVDSAVKQQAEAATHKVTIIRHRLTRRSRFDKVWNSLNKPLELTWGQIYWLIERQPRGQQGRLLTNGYARLFKVGSTLVYVSRGGGWFVRVWLFDSMDEWGAGYQVFSGVSETPGL